MKNSCTIFLYTFILMFNIGCVKKNKSQENEILLASLSQHSDCDTILYQLLHTSDFENRENYEIRVDEIVNDTIVIKAFVKNNLSQASQSKQIVENVVGWFIIPPQKDALYLSLNGLDAISPNFRKIKTKESFLNHFLNCIDQKKANDMNTEIKFTDLFNEGTIIEFTPKDLDKADFAIQEFKKKLVLYEKQHPLPEDFDINNLEYLINNETFFDSQYFTDSSWLQYFITKYKVDVTQLNDLMDLAIKQEDYDAVKILIENNYIVSKKDLKTVKEAKLGVKEKIESNKEEGYESYLETESKIREISELLINHYKKNHIQDPEGYTNLRKEKNAHSEILQRINTGDQVEVLDNTGDWFFVKTQEGKTGYVHKSRVKN